MKILTTLILCLLAHGLSAATPQMWVKEKGHRIPLRIDQIDAEVTITGSIAETVLTLRFRNETARMQEGEFVMPLPTGSTVSQYALEVLGNLRDGVSVEKEQARHAYETIKRQMIDPGLVEREAGNKYRTKVFPIPAKGTKLVRIGYIEHLPRKNGKLRYSLPTNYPGLIDEFSCTLRSHTALEIDAPGITFQKQQEGMMKCRVMNQKLPKSIILQAPLPEQNTAMLELHGDLSYFLINFSPPASVAEKPRHKPEHINIIWDASESRSQRNLKRELELLNHYFKYLGNTQVTLQVLRNSLQDAGTFEIKNGQWRKLKDTLLDTYYDGATAYADIQKLQKKANLTLIFTDGKMAELISLNQDQSTIIFHTSADSTLDKKYNHGFCASVNLHLHPVKKSLRHLTHTRFHLAEIQPKSHSILHVDRYGSSMLLGKTKQTAADFKLIYQNSNGEIVNHKVSSQLPKNAQGTSLIRRMWAQETLNHMETSSFSKDQIITHCRSYGLVSDYTSLIVLERFKDYVRFNIPPPEADLKIKWKKAREAQKIHPPTRQQIANRLNTRWREKLKWYQRTYSWMGQSLLARHQQTGIWLRATDKLFQHTDLDQQVHGSIVSWYNQVKHLAKKEKELKEKAAYQKWLAEQKKLIAHWNQLPEQVAKKSPTQQLAISVRGLVNEPGTYRSDEPLSLRKSIQLAGGKHFMGSLQHVSLYRNAHCMTYNLLSEKYKDIPLLPGDMIVVESEPVLHNGWDPFADAPAAPKPDPRKAPAFSSREPQHRDLSSEAAPFGGGGAPRASHTTIRIDAPSIQSTQQAAIEEFAQNLKNGKEAVAAYRQLKGKLCYDDTFYIETARILAKHGKKSLAIQVLSNLMEHSPPSDSRTRAFAYWLGEIGLSNEALALLQGLQKSNRKNTFNQLDIIRYAQKIHPQQNVAANYNSVLHHKDVSPPIDYLIFARTERNAYLKKLKTKPIDKNTENISTDLRCVIYSSDPSVKISTRIREPHRESTNKWQGSRQGGKLFHAQGIQEYMLRHAMPGDYLIECSADQPVTVQIAIYSHWGQPKQSCTWVTKKLTNRKSLAAQYTLEFEK